MKISKFILTSVFVSILVLSGCFQKKSSIPNENYAPWMDRFFEYILFSQEGAYTLHGSKPMTQIEVCLYSPQEVMDMRAELGIEANEQNSSAYPVVDLGPFLDGWKKWQHLKNMSHFPRFILTSKQDQEYPKLYHMYLINVLETALIITENYSFFRTALGFDFDPLEAVLEIEDENSKFWETIFNRSDLIGILYGFGRRNSQCFSWMVGASSSEDFEIPDSFQNSLRSSIFSSDGMFNGKESAKDLKIPVFRSFQNDDPFIQKYEEERKKIQSLYLGKNAGMVAIETLLK